MLVPLALHALACAPAAPPPPPTPEEQIVYQDLFVVRLNPLGLQNQFDLDYRHRIYDPGDSILGAGNYVGGGISPILTPGLMRLGVAAKAQLAAVAKLEVRFDYINVFGNFDLLQSYPDPNAEFSDSDIEDGGEAGSNYATDGWSLTFDLELRARVGPVIVRNRTKGIYGEMALREGDTVFYDQYWDLLLPGSGWFMTNDADLLFQVTPKLILGVRHTFGEVFYADSDFMPGSSRETDSAPTHRLGPLAAYTFFDEPGAAFNKPTIILILNWYLEHRWRTGADVSQGIPYVVLGFAFGGDLL